MFLIRREMLKLSFLMSAALFCLLSSMSAQNVCPSQAPAFQTPLPIPPVLDPDDVGDDFDHYTITMDVNEVQIRPLPCGKTRIYGYNGMYPGPTIKARRGRTTKITFINHLPPDERASVHLHGGHTPPDSDGHPDDWFIPRLSKEYAYPNNQNAATLWYHDHTYGTTARMVFMGLAGFYIIQDDEEEKLNLPDEDNDVPLVLQDRNFDSMDQYSLGGRDEFLGNTPLVNGAIRPFFEVGTRKVRFRILNGSNARVYKLKLCDQNSCDNSRFKFIQIGTDGGLLPHPVDLSEIEMAPGERVDAVIDFGQASLDEKIVLRDISRGGLGDIMQFIVKWQETDTSEVPDDLAKNFELLPVPADVTPNKEFKLDLKGGEWVINDHAFDYYQENPRTYMVKLGATEVWEFSDVVNWHPMHLHDVQFQIVAKGKLNDPDTIHMLDSTEREKSGWKDTILVKQGERIWIVAKFTDYVTGDSDYPYVIHCHKLEHEDHSMMTQFVVEP